MRSSYYYIPWLSIIPFKLSSSKYLYALKHDSSQKKLAYIFSPILTQSRKLDCFCYQLLWRWEKNPLLFHVFIWHGNATMTTSKWNERELCDFYFGFCLKVTFFLVNLKLLWSLYPCTLQKPNLIFHSGRIWQKNDSLHMKFVRQIIHTQVRLEMYRKAQIKLICRITQLRPYLMQF